MLTEEVEIINKLGLHARAAAKLVKVASAFEANIDIERDGHKVNAKSIMGVMMLAASQGTLLNVSIDGTDQVEAMDAVLDLINNRFDEDE
ncbi:MAG: HPr family phosphocarrier protein [Granulosicoccaceae bacterium]